MTTKQVNMVCWLGVEDALRWVGTGLDRVQRLQLARYDGVMSLVVREGGGLGGLRGLGARVVVRTVPLPRV